MEYHGDDTPMILEIHNAMIEVHKQPYLHISLMNIWNKDFAVLCLSGFI